MFLSVVSVTVYSGCLSICFIVSFYTCFRALYFIPQKPDQGHGQQIFPLYTLQWLHRNAMPKVSTLSNKLINKIKYTFLRSTAHFQPKTPVKKNRIMKHKPSRKWSPDDAVSLTTAFQRQTSNDLQERMNYIKIQYSLLRWKKRAAIHYTWLKGHIDLFHKNSKSNLQQQHHICSGHIADSLKEVEWKDKPLHLSVLNGWW